MIHAEFHVIESSYSIGLFGEPRKFHAVLRPSNMAPTMQNDRLPDGRGMALSVMIPTDLDLAQRKPRFRQAPEEPGFARQDFVLLDSRVFPTPDVRRFTLLLQTLLQLKGRDRVIGLLALGLTADGLKDLGRFSRMVLKIASDPLTKEYHSMTPYQLGPNRIAKYSLEPVEKRTWRALVHGWRSDSVASLLEKRLAAGPVELKFFVHVFDESNAPRGQSLQELVEDATLDWSKLGARKVHVATVVIPRQNATTDARRREAEDWRFSIWNALSDHRPLGNLNRARWAAYAASQRLRAAKPEEPADRLSDAAE